MSYDENEVFVLSDIDKHKKLMRKVFKAHGMSWWYTLNFHLLDDLEKNVGWFAALELLNSFGFSVLTCTQKALTLLCMKTLFRGGGDYDCKNETLSDNKIIEYVMVQN